MADLKIDVSSSWMGDKLYESVHKSVSNVVVEAGLKLEKSIHDKLRRKDNSGMMNPSRAGSPPAMASGALRESWAADLSSAKDTSPLVIVKSNLAYAAMMEYGSDKYGHIRPKNKKFLTIPLNEDAARLRRRHKNLRDVRGLFVVTKEGKRQKDKKTGMRTGKRFKGKSGSDTLLLAMEVKGTTTYAIQPMFLLVKKVWIKARPYVRPSLKTIQKKMNEKISKGILKGLKLDFRSGGGTP